MGRSHKDVVVVVAHDATGNVITEDIISPVEALHRRPDSTIIENPV